MIVFAVHHTRDPLTLIDNRAAFDLQFQACLDHASSAQISFALLMLDIDHFKSVNDAFGHRRGDHVLIHITTCLLSAIRSTDRLFRIGGDEFAILAVGTGPAEALLLAERVLALVCSSPAAGVPQLTLTISLGVATFPEDGITTESLFAAADRRHYQAKRAGRAQIAFKDSQADDTLQPPPRLIERDTLFVACRELLNALETERIGMLRLVGPRGAGRTRALAAVQTIASMLGYAILDVRGSPALQGRLYGALSRALRSLPGLRDAALSPGHLAEFIRQLLEQRGQHGLLIAIDDPQDLDTGSLELIAALCSDQALNRIALAITTDRPTLLDQLDLAMICEARLEPLSLVGLQTWLRHTLRWEPPLELAQWLQQHSRGLPGPFWQSIGALVQARGLFRSGPAWELSEGYRDVPLAGLAAPTLPMLSGLPEFIGRADEIGVLLDLVRQHRLVAIIGPGGMGKTRLALQVGAEVGEQLRDGVVFVPLASATDLTRVMPLIAEALGISGTGDLATAVHTALYQRELILILDNIEHLHGIERVIDALLQATEMPRLLITSRQRPTLQPAVIFELAGLELLQGIDQAAIQNSEAGLLLLRRLQQFHPNFVLHTNDLPAFEQICRILEGMPLGLELAASMASVSLPVLAEQFTDNLAALHAERPELPERHRSVAAVVAAFWARLSGGERAMLRRLSVFRAGFDQPAAQMIAQASPFFLDALAASGYVRRNPDGRYTIHELLRQYAEIELRRVPHDRRATEAQYAAYYAKLMLQSQPALLAGGALLSPLRREIENLIIAWLWSVRHARLDLLTQMAPGFARYWEITGQFHVGLPLLNQAITFLRQRRQSAPDDPTTLALLSHLLCRTIWAHLLGSGMNSTIAGLLEEAAHAAYTAEDPACIKECLLIQAVEYCYSDPARAIAQISQACQLSGSPQVQGECIRLLGIAYVIQGGLPDASRCYQEAFHYFQQIGDQLGICRTLVNLALYATETESFSETRGYIMQLLDSARTLGSSELEAYALIMKADLSILIADYRSAQRALAEAELVIRASGDPSLDLSLHQSHAWLLYALGDYTSSAQYSRGIIDQWNTSGRLIDWTPLAATLGHALAVQHQLAEADQYFELACTSSVVQNDAASMCHIAAGRAWVALQRNDMAQALRHMDALFKRLATNGIARQQEAFLVLQFGWEVLQAAADPRAQEFVREAQATLARRQAGIGYPEAAERYGRQMRARWPVLNVVS